MSVKSFQVDDMKVCTCLLGLTETQRLLIRAIYGTDIYEMSKEQLQAISDEIYQAQKLLMEMLESKLQEKRDSTR